MGTNKRLWDGNSDYIRANSGLSGYFTGKTGITIAFWYKDNSSAGTDIVFQIYRNSTATSSNWFKAEIDASGNITAYGRRLFADSDHTVVSSGPNLRDGSWHRVVLIYDYATPLTSIYVDGVLVGSSATGMTTGLMESSGSSARTDVGFPNTSCFAGYLLNFQIWDIPLSIEHVLWDHAFVQGIGTQAPNSPYGYQHPNLILWYRLDEAGLPYDYSGNGLTPTVSGTTIATPIADPTVPIKLLMWPTVPIPGPEVEAFNEDVTLDIALTIPPPAPSETVVDVDLVRVGIGLTVPLPDPAIAATDVNYLSFSLTVPPPGASLEAFNEDVTLSISLTVPPPTPFLHGGNARVYTVPAVFLPQPEFSMPGIMQGDSSFVRNAVLRGTTTFYRSAVLKGLSRSSRLRSGVLRCASTASSEFPAVLNARSQNSVNAVLRSSTYTRSFAVLRCDDGSIPIVEADLLNLRDSGIYSEPKDFFILQWVYGDWTKPGLSVPLLCVDRVERLYLLADHTGVELVEVLNDGVPMTAGWEYIPNFVDGTGRQVSMIQFKTGVADATLQARCRGKSFLSGQLIENPADIIIDMLENMQGYSYDFVDRAVMGEYRASCLRDGIVFRKLFDQRVSVKAVMTEFAMNTNAVHIRDKGQHGLKRREGWV